MLSLIRLLTLNKSFQKTTTIVSRTQLHQSFSTHCFRFNGSCKFNKSRNNEILVGQISYNQLLNGYQKFYSFKTKSKLESDEKTNENKRDYIYQFIHYFIFGASAFVVYWFIDENYVTFATVIGSSMQPEFNPNGHKFKDVVFGERSPIYDYDSLKRGDVVLFLSTRNPSQQNIKRVVGLEGDIVETIYHKHVVVPEGHCWVEGDNIYNSFDCNRTGPIPLGLIKAKVTAIIWPPTRWKTLERKIPHSRVFINQMRHPSDTELPSLNNKSIV